MCIIVTKERGHAAPTWTRIEASTDNNPDGFCFIYSKAKGEAPQVIRMLDRKSFLKKIKPLMDNDEANWILHARIMSVGRVCLENVHGWHDEETGLYFTHNGTLSIKVDAGMTDSETAFRHLLAPAARLGRKSLTAAAQAIIGHSKFAFMTKDGDIIRYGNYEEEDGVCYSNGSYKYSSYYPATTAMSKWSGYSGQNWKAGNFGIDEDEDYLIGKDSIGSTKYQGKNNVFLPASSASTQTTKEETNKNKKK